MDNSSMQTNVQNEEAEIDLGKIFRLLWSKFIIIVLVGLCFGVLALLYSKFLVTPMYESNTQLYVINRANENVVTYSDLQSATQLTKDYQVLVTSRYVMEKVRDDLSLSVSTDDLIGMISVSTQSDSRVLAISVKNKDPYMAKKIVDAVATISAQRICDVMKIEQVNIIDEGDLSENPVSPNVKRNILLGVAAGVLLACAVIIIKFIVDDTIKSSEDIEKYLGISTLALIPVTEAMYDGEKSTKGKKKKGSSSSSSSGTRTVAQRTQATPEKKPQQPIAVPQKKND